MSTLVGLILEGKNRAPQQTQKRLRRKERKLFRGEYVNTDATRTAAQKGVHTKFAFPTSQHYAPINLEGYLAKAAPMTVKQRMEERLNWSCLTLALFTSVDTGQKLPTPPLCV